MKGKIKKKDIIKLISSALISKGVGDMLWYYLQYTLDNVGNNNTIIKKVCNRYTVFALGVAISLPAKNAMNKLIDEIAVGFEKAKEEKKHHLTDEELEDLIKDALKNYQEY